MVMSTTSPLSPFDAAGREPERFIHPAIGSGASTHVSYAWLSSSGRRFSYPRIAPVQRAPVLRMQVQPGDGGVCFNGVHASLARRTSGQSLVNRTSAAAGALLCALTLQAPYTSRCGALTHRKRLCVRHALK